MTYEVATDGRAYRCPADSIAISIVDCILAVIKDSKKQSAQVQNGCDSMSVRLPEACMLRHPHADGI